MRSCALWLTTFTRQSNPCCRKEGTLDRESQINCYMNVRCSIITCGNRAVSISLSPSLPMWKSSTIWAFSKDMSRTLGFEAYKCTKHTQRTKTREPTKHIKHDTWAQWSTVCTSTATCWITRWWRHENGTDANHQQKDGRLTVRRLPWIRERSASTPPAYRWWPTMGDRCHSLTTNRLYM